MRAASLCALPFALALGCSSADRSPPPDQAVAQVEPSSSAPEAAEPKRPSFDQRAPIVGAPAPPLSLETLAGERVSLPGSNADRAAVLIFGSFS